MSKIVVLFLLLGILVAIYFYQLRASEDSEDSDNYQSQPVKQVRFLDQSKHRDYDKHYIDDESNISSLESKSNSNSASESNDNNSFDNFTLSDLSEEASDESNKSNDSNFTLSDL